MTRARWIAFAVILAGLAFAVEGGEYSTWDYFTLKQQAAAEADSVKVLTHDVDSLRAEVTAIEQDPRVQERVARERLGMIGKGEFVYRLRPDSQP